MTTTEARAIVRTVHFGLDWLHSEETYQQARAIVQAAKPVVEYATVDSEADDRAFEADELEYTIEHGVGRVQL